MGDRFTQAVVAAVLIGIGSYVFGAVIATAPRSDPAVNNSTVSTVAEAGGAAFGLGGAAILATFGMLTVAVVAAAFATTRSTNR